MLVTIQQATSSPPSQYEIETIACLHCAKKKWPTIKAQVGLFAPRDGLTAKIQGDGWIFDCHYDFLLTEGKNYHFKAEKVWRGVYRCEGPDDSLHLYRHKGLKYSIFQKDLQIAAFERDAVGIGGGDHYHLRLNNDANLYLMICLVLTIDVAEDEDSSSSYPYDLGNVGPEERLFDRSWKAS